ncbi:hypothetical protein D6783_02145 [Candidatus Woesearchaeota archaeon]|nr:MAG: hypothetical protein D6783_02145 [Candidatus Woesearchaeota archaeon]
MVQTRRKKDGRRSVQRGAPRRGGRVRRGSKRHPSSATSRDASDLLRQLPFVSERPDHNFALILVVLGLGLLLTWLALGGLQSPRGVAALEESGDLIAKRLAMEHAIREDGVDLEALKAIAEMDYEEVKQELGVQEDFCIVVEDAEGRVIPIGEKVGIGSDELLVGGVPCGRPT